MYDQKIMARFIIVSALILFLLIIPALVQHCNAVGDINIIYAHSNETSSVMVNATALDPFKPSNAKLSMSITTEDGHWIDVSVESFADGDIRMTATVCFVVQDFKHGETQEVVFDWPVLAMFDGGAVLSFDSDLISPTDGYRAARIREHDTGEFFNRIVHTSEVSLKASDDMFATFNLNGTYGASLALINEMGRRGMGTTNLEESK